MRHVVPQEPAPGSKPLTEPVLLILTSLAAHPRHGYALIRDIELLSAGRVRMSTGTLFGALRRLLEDGWIERFEQADTAPEAGLSADRGGPQAISMGVGSHEALDPGRICTAEDERG